jgi:uncharacterized protein (TIGR03067 family)
MVRRAYLSLTVGLLMATIGSAFAPAPVYREPPKPKVPEIYALMQGTWEIERNVNLNRRGVAIRRVFRQIRIKGDTWGTILNDNGTEIESTKYQIVFDPKANPATLDLKHTVRNGFNGIAVIDRIMMKGIIKVEGDTLTFCYVNGRTPNAERPTQFSDGNRIVPNGAPARTMTLKRVK